MEEKVINLKSDEQFITLGILLKIARIIDTGGMAKAFLAVNTVLVNGEEENRRGRKLYSGDLIEIHNKMYRIA